MNVAYLFFIAVLVAVLNASLAFSQNTAKRYDKAEAGLVFSHQRVGDTGGFDDSIGFNGFDASVTGNLTRYFGIKGAVSGAYRNKDFSLPGFGPGTVRQFTVRSSVYTYLAGIQIKDNRKTKKLNSFFHALAGGGTLTQKFTGDCLSEAADPCAAFNYSVTGFAAAIGGGIDVRVGKRLSIRIIQADYNPIFAGGGTLNNFRIGAGIVFH